MVLNFLPVIFQNPDYLQKLCVTLYHGKKVGSTIKVAFSNKDFHIPIVGDNSGLNRYHFMNSLITVIVKVLF